MTLHSQILVTFFVAIAVSVVSCKHDSLEPATTASGYPEDVERIVVMKCATSGCHNETSKEAAAGLSLETWEAMFRGSRGGAVVIPFRPDFSTIIYYTNVYDDYGFIHAEPLMPYNADTLTKDEVGVLYNWIISGAPNKDGFVKFSDNPQRKKFYIGNQGCDEVAVFDANSMLAMRFVHSGGTPGTEAPHTVRVAPNNEIWCVSSANGQYFQVFSTADNSLLAQIDLPFGSWNTFAISPDSKKAYASEWSGNGSIAVIDLENNTAQVHGGYFFPHGTALSPDGGTLYVTGNVGNYIYKAPASDPSAFAQISLDGNAISSDSSLNINDIVLSPDGNRYFVTCEHSDEVRAVNRNNDSVVAVIPVGDRPEGIAICSTNPFLFVTCTEDENTFPGKRGSVYIINYLTNTVVASLQTGHQPHGIGIDESNNRVYITHRNVTSGGPAPHHASLCNGKNGYVTAIDLSTLQLIDGFKAEVSVDPYSLGMTH